MATSSANPDGSTDIMGTFFYRTGIGGEILTGRMDAGMGATIAVVIFVVLLAGVVAWLYLSSKQEYEL